MWVTPTLSLHRGALPSPDHGQHRVCPLPLGGARMGGTEALAVHWGEGQDGNW